MQALPEERAPDGTSVGTAFSESACPEVISDGGKKNKENVKKYKGKRMEPP